MKYHHLPTSKARTRFAELLTRVWVDGDRVVLQRHGEDVAVLVPIEDLRRLKRLEDREDPASSGAALAESDERISRCDVRKPIESPPT